MSDAPHDLRMRAQAGDANACAKLGWKLILGEDVAPSPPEGWALLQSALGRNDAEAAYLVARMAAWGVYQRPNHTHAMQLLRRAADGGWAPATKELSVLESATAPGALEKSQLSDEPRICVIRNFASPEECDWVIASGRDALDRARVFRRSAEGQAVDSRTNSEADFTLARADVVLCGLRNRIARAVGVPPVFFEVAKLLHYAPGQEFAPHHDFLDTRHERLRVEVEQRGQRIVTFLLYLNDAYTGGETRFPKVGEAFKGRKGDALYFANVGADGAPDPRTLHAGAPPDTGEKWILSQWIRDKPINAFQAPPPFDPLDPNWRSTP